MSRLFFIFFTFVLIFPAFAQVSVQVQPDRRQYLANEPVTAVVTITNRSGRELSFVSTAEGRIAHSWLDFSMRDTVGTAMPKITNRVFSKAVIPAGQSMSRRVNLSSMFSVARVGNYAFTAHVRQPGLDDSGYTSNSGHFTVGSGHVVFKQQYGVPGQPAPKREFRVVTFNDGERTSIFVQVMDAVLERAIASNRLSEFLPFVTPQTVIDGKNNLHVLYLGSPEIFVQVSLDQNGQTTATRYYRRVDGRVPRFVTFANGEVRVQGGVPYDPGAEAANQARARKASDRPK